MAFDCEGSAGLVAFQSPVRSSIDLVAKPRRKRNDALECDEAADAGGTNGLGAPSSSGATAHLATYDPPHYGDAPVAGRCRH